MGPISMVYLRHDIRSGRKADFRFLFMCGHEEWNGFIQFSSRGNEVLCAAAELLIEK